MSDRRRLARREALLALVASTGSVVVGGCRRRGGDGARPERPGTPVEPAEGTPSSAASPGSYGATGEAHAAPQPPPDDKLGRRLPLRRLGGTGVEVTMLGAGGVHIGDASERDAEEVIEAAIVEGVRFFDTANMYSGGRSEERLGKYLVPKYREHVFLMTKSLATNDKDATRDLETSLRRCGCDYFDLWQMHAVQDPADADGRVAGGVLDACERALKDGKVKHLGFTGHANFRGHLRMLEHVKARGLPIATAQMPINLVDPHYASFTTHVVKPCLDHGMGILAMKTLAFGRLLGKNLGWQRQDVTLTPVVPDVVSLEQALHYVWSLPVSVLISGMESASQVRENAAIARRASALDETTRLKLVAAVERFAGRDVEFYKD